MKTNQLTREKRLPTGWSPGQPDALRRDLKRLPLHALVTLTEAWINGIVRLPIVRSGPGPGSGRRGLTRAGYVALGRLRLTGAGYVALQCVDDAVGVFTGERTPSRTKGPLVIATWRWMHQTFCHAIGPADLEFDPSWRTATAVALAAGIAQERAFDRMPILADALQDAGCDNLELIEHLQGDVGELTNADWVLRHLLADRTG